MRMALAMAAAVCGCTSTGPPPAPPPAVPPSAEEHAALTAALGIERRWLRSWFAGTPVAIAQRRDGVLTVDVPHEFCFDAGRADIKPALGAVLDKVADSLRRRSAANVSLLAAPGDVPGATPLALRRAAAVRDRLLARGVAATRMAAPTAATKTGVELWIGP